MKTILAIDIGNTNIHLAVMKSNEVLKLARLETTLKKETLKKKLAAVLKKFRMTYTIEEAVVCGVVPRASDVIKSTIRKILQIEVSVIGENIFVPIVNRYDRPKQVGQDRLVCAYAVMVLYGVPAIVIDFGTASTFDVVSSQKEYLGGIIVPGIRLSAESLFKKTALLPKVKIKAPRNLIGKNTKDSILSGLFYGYGAMSCGLIDLIEKKFGGKLKVIVTGGYTEVMKKFIDAKVDVIDNDLVLKGIFLVWKSQVQESSPKKS